MYYLSYDDFSYYDVQKSILTLKNEVENLDDNALLEECEFLVNEISDIYLEKISDISSKKTEGMEITEQDRNFLMGIYFMYYCKYSYVVDVKEEDIVR